MPVGEELPPLVGIVPGWITAPSSRLTQFIKYTWNVYNLPERVASLSDGRRRPTVATAEVVRALMFTAVFRLPSLNALEGELKGPGYQRLVGRRAEPGEKAFSADTVARVLDSLNLDGLRRILYDVVWKAERNKVFRDGPHDARRVVAIDGWEPFSSYYRHCDDCLEREVKFQDGKRTQYYHRFVVALLLCGDCEVVLDIESLRTADLRRQDGVAADTHEGELTAAHRLIDRLHTEFGSFIDQFVVDALYPNGPWMTHVAQLDYGAVATIKKETDEPLKDALAIMAGQPPDLVWDDPDKKEHIEAWDVNDIETLDTYKGKVRVLRALVSSDPEKPATTWCAAVVGDRARQLPARTVHNLHRKRWHVENTAFNQWTQYWHLDHVFRHTPNAVVAVMLLWCLAFNLVQLFHYKRLRRPRKPKDPCDTLRALVSEMAADVRLLTAPVPWRLLVGT